MVDRGSRGKRVLSYFPKLSASIPVAPLRVQLLFLIEMLRAFSRVF